MIRVFYDGQCGLCRREIHHYQKIAPHSVFEWIDITQAISSFESHGFSYQEGLKLLHAQDDKGQFHIGIDAFILLWSQIPRWRVLAKIVKNKVFYAVFNWLYRRFAEWRFQRLSHCQRF